MLHRAKELADSVFLPVYAARGRRPYSQGYYTAKRRLIQSAIDSGLTAAGGDLPPGYGARMDERVVEYPWTYARLPGAPGRVLDAGSALNYGYLLERRPVRDADLTICTLAPEKRCYWNRGVSYVFGDLRHSIFRDAAFDVVVSISTIEHIGLDNSLLYADGTAWREDEPESHRAAVREFRRLLRPGGLCLITVPFGRAANHGWFQVFDAAMVQGVVDAFAPSAHAIDYFGYDGDRGWRRSAPEPLAEATFFDVQKTRAFDADFAAGARAVACLALTA